MFRTLIVDDNQVFRETFRAELLNHLPYISIQEAKDGQEAIEKIRLLPFSLIFVDICLPRMNGLELMHKIKKAYPGIGVVVMTTYNLPEYQHAAIKNGADIFLIKDRMKWEEIEKLVNSILKDNQRRRSLFQDRWDLLFFLYPTFFHQCFNILGIS